MCEGGTPTAKRGMPAAPRRAPATLVMLPRPLTPPTLPSLSASFIQAALRQHNCGPRRLRARPKNCCHPALTLSTLPSLSACRTKKMRLGSTRKSLGEAPLQREGQREGQRRRCAYDGAASAVEWLHTAGSHVLQWCTGTYGEVLHGHPTMLWSGTAHRTVPASGGPPAAPAAAAGWLGPGPGWCEERGRERGAQGGRLRRGVHCGGCQNRGAPASEQAAHMRVVKVPTAAVEACCAGAALLHVPRPLPHLLFHHRL